MGFNIVLGGYMSIKRVAESIPIDMWIPADVAASTSLSYAVLKIFRDEGARGDRQKARLMWLIEEVRSERHLPRACDLSAISRVHAI